MSEIVKRLKLNRISFFITIFIASAAAFSTLFFALSGGVKYITTIIFRVFISFSVFVVIGYFVAEFLESEYLQALKNNDSKKFAKTQMPQTRTVAEEQGETAPAGATDSETETNEPTESFVQTDEQTDKEKNMSMPNDDSFDKIVVVDEDTDK